MNPKIIALNNPIDHAKILDEASDPLIALNSDYQFTYANKAFAQALGGRPRIQSLANNLFGNKYQISSNHFMKSHCPQQKSPSGY